MTVFMGKVAIPNGFYLDLDVVITHLMCMAWIGPSWAEIEAYEADGSRMPKFINAHGRKPNLFAEARQTSLAILRQGVGTRRDRLDKTKMLWNFQQMRLMPIDLSQLEYQLQAHRYLEIRHNLAPLKPLRRRPLKKSPTTEASATRNEISSRCPSRLRVVCTNTTEPEREATEAEGEESDVSSVGTEAESQISEVSNVPSDLEGWI